LSKLFPTKHRRSQNLSSRQLKIQKMKISSKHIPYIIIGCLVAFGLNQWKIYMVSSPQRVKLGLRQEIVVAQNRAGLRLMPDIDKGGGPDREETVSDSPIVDIKCGQSGKELYSIRLTPALNEKVCGVQVRVLKVYKGGLSGEYPYADVEVVW